MLTQIPYVLTCRTAAWNLVRGVRCNRRSLCRRTDFWPTARALVPSAVLQCYRSRWERTEGDGLRRNGTTAGEDPGVAGWARSARAPRDHGRRAGRGRVDS